ncbi:MAG: hypothetical protein WBA12_13515, partial [Catalinimonas sp.]
MWRWVFCIWLAHAALAAQPADSTATLDVLRAPSSPGFVLLDVAPASVESPTDPTDVLVSFANATGNFSALPRNYALEVAPGWLVGGNRITYDDWARTRNPLKSLYQTTTLSFAVGAPAGIDTATQVALGIKGALIKPPIDPLFQGYRDSLRTIVDVLADVGAYADRLRNDLKQGDPFRRALQDSLMRVLPNPDVPIETKQRLVAQLEAVERELMAAALDSLRERFAAERARLRYIAENLPVRRVGAWLDVAGGVVFDFPGQRVGTGRLDRWGAWLT